jgi:GT2 family glycosyltransferase
MRCTIVVATRDRHEQLAATLRHHRSLPERPAVVVVDDASDEPAVAPGAELIRLPESAGAAARNAGALAARTPYLALTDDDAWWAPGALRWASALLDAHPRLALVQAHVLVGAKAYDDPTCVRMGRGGVPAHGAQPGTPIVSFVACAVVIRRSAFLSCGGFSPRLGTGGEEQLLSWDLMAAGWQLSYVPAIVAHHAPPPAPDGRLPRRETTIRNALWTAWLRRPLPVAARQTARALARACTDRVTARAVGRAVAGGRWVWGERRVNPPHVEAMCRAVERGPLPSARRPTRSAASPVG